MKTEIKKYLDSHSFMFRKEFLLSLLVFVVVGFAATFLFYNSAIDISTKIPVKKQESNSVSRKRKTNCLYWSNFQIPAKYNFQRLSANN